MANPDQVAAVLRFALDDLGALNAHHDFEHLCRHVARARIAANILPATGPVSARGDQSRDFETYTTHLPRELPGTSVFTTGTTDEIVFACTIRKSGIERKIKDDVAGIIEPGAPEEIHYFCTQPVDSGLRHQLQAWAKATHGVRLEIHDVHALGEHLASPDLFWVAERYLNLPAEIRPQQEETSGLSSWYVEARHRWRSRAAPPSTLGDLIDLKDGLRQATFDADTRADLPFWLSLMRVLTGPESPTDLRQRARYEVAVATLRGQDDLRPAESMVREYYDDITTSETPALLEDGAVLLMYCGGALARGLTDLDADTLAGWNAALRSQVRSLLELEPPANRRAALLDVLAHLGIHLDLRRPHDTGQTSDGGDAHGASSGDMDMPPMVDLDGSLDTWTELIALLPEAAMFPVGRLVDFFGLMAPLLVSQDRYGPLRDALDEQIARISGRAAVADACRRRASALLAAGHIIEALHELHRAKVDWWSGDTIRGSLRAMLLIAEIYLQLRLPTAARYYALAALYGVDRSGREEFTDLVSECLALAARADHLAGAWWSEVELLALGVKGHVAYVEPHLDLERFPYLEPGIAHGATALTISRLLGHRLTDKIEALLEDAGILHLLNDVLDGSDPDTPMTRDEWLGLADGQLCGRPFSDVGPMRCLRWSALGLDWTVRCRNRRLDVLATERFVAAAQILSVELLDNDLVLMPARIDVLVDAPPAGDPGLGARARPSNEGREWQVSLTAYEGPGSLDVATADLEPLVALAQILTEVSLLSPQSFFDALDAAFRRGLGHKLHSARPYDEVADLLDGDHFSDGHVQYAVPLGPPAGHPARPAPQLEPLSIPGPTYSTGKARELLRNRYDRLPKILAITLPRLNNDPAFRRVVSDLREQGWLDWHLLTAASNISLNYRARQLGALEGSLTPDQQRELGQMALRTETADMTPVPLSLFTLDRMETARNMSMLQLVNHWDLGGNQATPDFPAITQLLADRYGYWTDDMPHEDPFPPGPGD